MGRNYDDLSPFDFECLVRDLFNAKFETSSFEVFSPGPDGGVDVRLLRSAADDVYIQCKHYARSHFSKLYKEVEREAKRVGGKLTGEYWLVTSMGLTADNKRKLSELYKPGFLPQARVLSRFDLDVLLSKYPRVEQSNYKLYMTSVPVMQKLLDAEVHFRSSGLMIDVRKKVKTAVKTAAFDQAREMLKQWHTCIISGEPGIGKTTLAHMLLFSLVDEGFECVAVSGDIRDAERLFRPGAKQVFLYDDFLGRNTLEEKMGKNEDGRLVDFMRRLEGEDNHYFILTTREYILRRAASTYERLDDDLVWSKKYVLDMRSYSRVNRAHILYNHLYYSDLSSDAISSVLRDGLYKKIIDHRFYNPRLIEDAVLLVKKSSPETYGGSSFGKYFLEYMSNPEKLWSHAFEKQLSRTAREMLLVLATLPDGVYIDDLFEAVISLQAERDRSIDTDQRLNDALREIEDVFVRTNVDLFSSGLPSMVELSNPSFRDYLYRYMAANKRIVPVLVQSAVYFEQLEVIQRWATASFVPKSTALPLGQLGATVRSISKTILSKMVELRTARPCGVGFLKGMYFSRPDDSVLGRVASIAKFANGFEERLPESVIDVMASFPEELVAQRYGSYREKDGLLGFVRQIADSNIVNEDQRAAILRHSLPLLRKNIADPEKYLEIFELMSELDPPSAEAMRDGFRDYIDLYVERALEEDLDFIDSAIESMYIAAEGFAIDIDDKIQDLEQQKGEPESSREPDHEGLGKKWKEEVANHRSNVEIENLFGTLQ